MLKMCACKTVYYCSPECQKRSWKSHKDACKAARAERAAAATKVAFEGEDADPWAVVADALGTTEEEKKEGAAAADPWAVVEGALGAPEEAAAADPWAAVEQALA
jgi:hypothetical protein